MLLAGGEDRLFTITHFVNSFVAEGRIPNDWSLSFVINCFKGEGDTLEIRNYRGLKLLDQM